jgi:hypothetical protein
VFKAEVKRVVFNWLESRGYDMQAQLLPYQRRSRAVFFAAEHAARQRYAALPAEVKAELPMRLEAKYRNTPVLGTISVYDAIAELAHIIDPLDPYLGAVSQLTHQLQMVSLMEDDGVEETLILCGLIHDLGKLLIKFGDEDPINVEAAGKKVPLSGELGGGLLACTFRWDHGDFAYLRLKDHAAPEVAWVVRHHSLDLPACEPYMNDQDRAYSERYLKLFVYYDERKDLYALPKKGLEDYRSLIDRAFPGKIVI